MTVKKVLKGVGTAVGAVVGTIFGIGCLWGAIFGQSSSSSTNTDYSYDSERKRRRDDDNVINARVVDSESKEAIEKELERLWKQYNEAGYFEKDDIMERIKEMEAKL